MKYSYLTLKHLDSILEIEEESNPFPWSAINFRDWIDRGYYSLALEDEKELIGFAIMAISSEESHLLNVGVKKEKRGRGRRGPGGASIRGVPRPGAPPSAGGFSLEIPPGARFPRCIGGGLG